MFLTDQGANTPCLWLLISGAAVSVRESGVDDKLDAAIAKIDELRSAVMSGVQLNRTILWNLSASLIRDILESERGREPARLLRHGFKVCSQNDEDGIIEEIFNRIGTVSKTFLEFGVESGVECNSLYLLHKGWSGAWIEGSDKHCQAMQKSHAQLVKSGRLNVINQMVDAENINQLIEQNGLGGIDLLSIDIDGNDYWVWKAIEAASPRVVVIEYNAIFPASVEWVVEYEPRRAFDGTLYHSAALKSYELLAAKKGYSLVGCNINGCNAFFVRNDLLARDGKDLFSMPYTAENHYEPFRHPYLKLVVGKRATPKMPASDV